MSTLTFTSRRGVLALQDGVVGVNICGSFLPPFRLAKPRHLPSGREGGNPDQASLSLFPNLAEPIRK